MVLPRNCNFEWSAKTNICFGQRQGPLGKAFIKLKKFKGSRFLFAVHSVFTAMSAVDEKCGCPRGVMDKDSPAPLLRCSVNKAHTSGIFIFIPEAEGVPARMVCDCNSRWAWAAWNPRVRWEGWSGGGSGVALSLTAEARGQRLQRQCLWWVRWGAFSRDQRAQPGPLEPTSFQEQPPNNVRIKGP